MVGSYVNWSIILFRRNQLNVWFQTGWGSSMPMILSMMIISSSLDRTRLILQAFAGLGQVIWRIRWGTWRRFICIGQIRFIFWGWFGGVFGHPPMSYGAQNLVTATFVQTPIWLWKKKKFLFDFCSNGGVCKHTCSYREQIYWLISPPMHFPSKIETIWKWEHHMYW